MTKETLSSKGVSLNSDYPEDIIFKIEDVKAGIKKLKEKFERMSSKTNGHISFGIAEMIINEVFGEKLAEFEKEKRMIVGEEKYKSRNLKCWTCGKTTKHNQVPYDDVWECEICGGLRKIDGTPSLGELMNLPKGGKNENTHN